MLKKDKDTIDWLTFMQSLQSIAQTGIAYAKDVYDKERYQDILNLVSDQYADITGAEQTKVKATLFNEVGYATPKICVRGLCFKGDKILLVKEREENLWSLPGGWAEINLSPSESLIKEIKEETGLDSEVTCLLSLWDKQKHDHPEHWPHTYLAFYHCKLLGGVMQTSHEISEIEFFNIDSLPELSTHRVTEKQILTLVNMVKNKGNADFD